MAEDSGASLNQLLNDISELGWDIHSRTDDLEVRSQIESVEYEYEDEPVNSCPCSSPVFPGADPDDDIKLDWDLSDKDSLDGWQDFSAYFSPDDDDDDVHERGDEEAWPSEQDMISDHSSVWEIPEEPAPELMPNGLPAFHTCSHCQHIVIDSGLLHEGQQIPLFQVHLHGKGRFFDSVRDKTFRTKYWTLEERGDYGISSDNHFDVVAQKGDPAARYISTRPVNLHVASKESFERARRWLKECHASHSKCRELESSKLPARVVDVRLGTSEDPKLYLSKPNKVGRFVALSYCWGGDQHIKATLETLKRWTQALPFIDLSQSIQDAISVTRQLGIPFLWVDSLCIIQDDPDDRAKEIAKMPQIYKEAYCTISAASAGASHQGFLQPREGSKERRHMVGLPYLCPDGRIGRVYLSRQEQHSLEKEPIHSRAWTLQEHVLSCRVIIYGPWQLRWECKTTRACDGGPSNSYGQCLESLSSRLYTPPFRKTPSAKSLQDLLVASANGSEHWKYRNMMDLWSDIVQDFTTRKLSLASDRPLAISGLAERYGKIIGGKYLAGLWERNLVNRFLWRRASSFKGPRRRSPSWSWTSIDGKADWWRFQDTSGAQISLLDCKIELVSQSAPFGAVNSASLILQGRLRKAWYNVEQREQIHLHPWSTNTLKSDSCTAATAVWDDTDLDLELQASYSSAIWCLEVLPFLPPEDDDPGTVFLSRPKGILLVQDSETGHFHRVGYFDFVWSDGAYWEWYHAGVKDFEQRRDLFRKEVFEECPLSTITIT